MKLVVGLGNIGPEYAGTRHNIGFMVADELAGRWNAADNWRKADNAWYLEERVPEKIILIKPTTYMNRSGAAVYDFASFYHLAPQDILVIQDDMDLPVGTLRVRRKGTSGGHNGLKSIEQALGSQEYPRIKVGIGHPVHEEKAVISHVLHRFEGKDKETIDLLIKKAADAVEDWMKGASINELSQHYNIRPEQHDKVNAPEQSGL
jgi:PTH1 family peptidyl-tRNA hydrolase